MASGWPKLFGVTSFPTSVYGYHASQLRAAYRANGANTGKSRKRVEDPLIQRLHLLGRIAREAGVHLH